MPDFQNPADYQYAKDLLQGSAVEANAFLALKRAAERADGVIPAKTRELISVAVALSLQCAYCIDVHTKSAKAAGATPEEMAEVVFVTAAIKAGAAVGHGQMVMRMYGEAPSPAATAEQRANPASPTIANQQ